MMTLVEQSVALPCALCGAGEQVRRYVSALGAASGSATCRGCGAEVPFVEAVRRALELDEARAAMIVPGGAPGVGLRAPFRPGPGQEVM